VSTQRDSQMRNLRGRFRAVLLAVNAVAAALAALVLVISPATIPAIAGVHIDKDQYLLCYLLAGSEFAIAAMCWFALRSGQASALQIAIATLIALHLTTAGLAVFGYAAGTSPAIWLNIAFRLAISLLLWLSIPKSAGKRADRSGAGQKD